MKSGISLEIPDFGRRGVRVLVSDFTGTLSYGGKLAPEVEEGLLALAERVEIHILTSDTFGTASNELKGVPCSLHLLKGAAHDIQKRDYVLSHFKPEQVAAFGNGNNDALLLRAVKAANGLAIAVDNGEGCATEALLSANLFIVGARNALDLLLDGRRIVATLRA